MPKFSAANMRVLVYLRPGSTGGSTVGTKPLKFDFTNLAPLTGTKQGKASDVVDVEWDSDCAFISIAGKGSQFISIVGIDAINVVVGPDFPPYTEETIVEKTIT